MKHHTLSRVAERLYWLGRYTERAESMARLITETGDLLIDSPVRVQDGWHPLIEIAGNQTLFASLFDESTEHNVVRFLTTDTRNPGSIIQSITSARENARTVRETMPRITFELINDLYLYAKTEMTTQLSRSRRGEVMNGIARRVQQLEGFLSGNMMHGEPWNFLRVGNHLERADMTTRVIDVRSVEPSNALNELEPFHDIRWRAVLRSLYALQSYRASMQEPIEQAPVLDFLFLSPELPRSYLRCLQAMRNSLRSLPRSEKPLRICNRMIRTIKQTDVRALKTESLHQMIDDCQVQLAGLHDAIGKTYFYVKPRIRRSKRQ